MMDRRTLLAGGLAALAASALPGALLAAPAKPRVIRFGVSSAGVGNPPRSGTGTLDVVQAHRYLEQEFAADGIAVKWMFFKGQGPATNEAMSNSQIDFVSQGALPSIIGRAAGLDTRVVYISGARGNSYVGVPADSAIKSVKELRGKRVAFNKGTAGHLSAIRILDLHGLTERDVRVINLEPGAALAAFQSGDLDAIFGGLNLLNLRNKGVLRLIFDTRHTPVATAPGHVLVRQPFAEQYPDVTRRVVTSLVRAARWSSDDANRDALFSLWSQFGSTSKAMYQEEYAGVAMRDRLTPLADPFILARQREAIADAYRFKLIRRTIDPAQWLDTHYLNAALKELKLEHYWSRFDAQGRRLT